VKLYYAPGACSLSPHIVASEAGIALDFEKVDLKTHKTETGEDYYAVNPKGYVPALKLDDGAILTEGPAIVQYLADSTPSSGLLPPVGDFKRYRVIEWLTFINGEIHKNFGPLFSDAPEEAKAKARDTIRKRFDTVGTALGEQDYLTGASFTAADAYLFVVLRWAGKMGITVPGNLDNLFARIAARPQVHAALREEGLAD
jgi:glutathione S-transferase